MERPLPHFIRLLPNWLLKPHSRVTNPEKIQRSRLLSMILLVLISLVTFVLILVLRRDPTDINEPTVKGGFLLIGIILVMYIINRLGYTSIPAMGVVLAFAAVFIYIPFYSGESPIFLAFLMIPIVFTAIFFPIGWTTITSIGILALIGILISFVDQSTPGTSYWNLRNMWFFLILGTGLILTFMWHLNNLEKIRQKELVRINKQLEQQVAELEQFTYTVSHDLKSPLITIKGFLGFLREDAINGNSTRLESDIQRIGDATEKMSRLLNELLDLSRIGRAVNPPQEFSLRTLAEEAVELEQMTIKQHGVSIHIDDDLPAIYGDRQRILSVLQNLINNSAKNMGDQPNPRIEIGKHNKEDELIFHVKDNGIGIDPKFHIRIFGLFEKLNPASDGTGVGLALIKRIIEVHGGRIWVESDGIGKGSTFCFTIPKPVAAFVRQDEN